MAASCANTLVTDGRYGGTQDRSFRKIEIKSKSLRSRRPGFVVRWSGSRLRPKSRWRGGVLRRSRDSGMSLRSIAVKATELLTLGETRVRRGDSAYCLPPSRRPACAVGARNAVQDGRARRAPQPVQVGGHLRLPLARRWPREGAWAKSWVTKIPLAVRTTPTPMELYSRVENVGAMAGRVHERRRGRGRHRRQEPRSLRWRQSAARLAEAEGEFGLARELMLDLTGGAMRTLCLRAACCRRSSTTSVARPRDCRSRFTRRNNLLLGAGARSWRYCANEVAASNSSGQQQAQGARR